jgi:hypothetical protein
MANRWRHGRIPYCGHARRSHLGWTAVTGFRTSESVARRCNSGLPASVGCSDPSVYGKGLDYLHWGVPTFCDRKVIISGKDFYSPHGAFSRFDAAELLVFFLASLFLIYRISVNHNPTVYDRFAFTVYLASLVLASSGNFSLVLTWQITGLVALFVTWYLSRKKRRRHLANDIRTAE